MLYVVMGVIGALIGWGTNMVAIWLLFRPRHPVHIGPWELQGLLPRRQSVIARSIGQAVEKDLLTTADLSSHLANLEMRSNLSITLRTLTNKEIDRLLPKLLPQPLRCWLIQYLNEWLEQEEDRLMDTIINNIATNISQFNISTLIESRLNSFPLEELESLIWGLTGKELRYIEYAGGILGAIIGLLQAAVLSFTKTTLLL
ncbi:MAG: DUF445 domain-containing protein [bacterium]|jgi:uncharacterized membrane protein YheB (UPF0754 family)